MNGNVDNFIETFSKLIKVIPNFQSYYQDGFEEFLNQYFPDLSELSGNIFKSEKLFDDDYIKLLSDDKDFVRKVNHYDKLLKDIANRNKWFSQFGPQDKHILYISPEFGLHQQFPNYAGGLGILAGDHLKSSIDLGVPIIGIGLFYKNGYFNQSISQSFHQKVSYDKLNPEEHGFFPFVSSSPLKEFLILEMDLISYRIYAKVWYRMIGDQVLFLLDTNVPQNPKEFKGITDKLYGGDREHRILQEIVLGLGSIELAEVLFDDIPPMHINEGHASFAILHKIRKYKNKNKENFQNIAKFLKNEILFTTHTPVIHGNEEFDVLLMEKYLKDYVESLGISWDKFLSFGQTKNSDKNNFMMTSFALRFSEYANGVSKLHGETAREMWKDLWKKDSENTIDYVTNGVHIPSWISKEFDNLYRTKIGKNWALNLGNGDFIKSFKKIKKEDLVEARKLTKLNAVENLNKYLSVHKANFLKDEHPNIEINPKGLLITFARRIAPYKRTHLLFTDMKRLTNIIRNSGIPVQIVISGKAHPKDVDGKKILKKVVKEIVSNGLESDIIFIENYNVEIAKYLVKASDIWLNNPIRPLEASGTSGMKSALNGGINFSILDGWWDEAFNGDNGWILDKDNNKNDYEQALEIYETLENIIIPLFKNKLSNNKNKWDEIMQNSILTITEKFSSHRMVMEYSEKFYLKMLNY